MQDDLINRRTEEGVVEKNETRRKVEEAMGRGVERGKRGAGEMGIRMRLNAERSCRMAFHWDLSAQL